MAKPATEARNDAIIKGFPIVHKRLDNGLDMKNADGKHYAIYQIGGGWHYGDGLETDTAWEADSDSNYLKMVKAGYNLRARKLFNAGDLIQWTDPVSGQWVTFQPKNLQWIGDYDSNSVISTGAAIAAPTVNDDQLLWPAAFGSGIDFRYTATPTQLTKHVIVGQGALPACPAYITNPYIEMTFTLDYSTGVNAFVDGVAWDKTTTKTTASRIEFRLENGTVVWSMAAPLAYDSSEEGNPCNGQIKLYVNKKVKYAAVRFPKSWIDSAVFPIMLDPTVDYQVGASGNDGVWDIGGSWISATDWFYFGTYSSVRMGGWARFTGVTIPDGATINTSYLSFYYNGKYGSPQACSLYAENATDPAAPTTAANADGRTKTSASISISSEESAAAFWNTGSINSIISELMAARSYAGGAVMQFLIIPPSMSGTHYWLEYSYDMLHANSPKLHIEYTEAASGKPAANVIWIG